MEFKIQDRLTDSLRSYVVASDYSMYQKVYQYKFIVSTQCNYVFCTDLVTNSNVFSISVFKNELLLTKTQYV